MHSETIGARVPRDWTAIRTTQIYRKKKKEKKRNENKVRRAQVGQWGWDIVGEGLTR